MACQAIGRQPRGEYDKDWPEVGVIRARCEAIMRYQREQTEQARPKLTDGQKSATKEQLDMILAKIRQLTKAKVMR